MTNITYVGGNVVDWNTQMDKSELSRLVKMIKDNNGNETHFQLEQDQLWEIVEKVEENHEGDHLYLYLHKDPQYKFDKNQKGWETEKKLPDEKRQPQKKLSGLRRPGGGAANNIHNAGTLAKTIGSDISLELLVSQESRFVRACLGSELSGTKKEVSYYAIRECEEELDNVNFRCDGKKFTFTSQEKPMTCEEIQRLQQRLDQRCADSRDMLVINSVKDMDYLGGIIHWYAGAKTKPKVVAAVTSSMLKDKVATEVKHLVAMSDIYVSNLEELHSLLKDSTFAHKKTWDVLENSDIYVGMLEILKQQKAAGKAGKVYVTCGDTGSLMMDSKGMLYFQKVSSMIKGPGKKDSAVDLNGAGDTFTGVMTLLEAEGKYTDLEIFDYANAAAQICIRRPGANGKDRITKEEIVDFRKKHSQNMWKYDPTSGDFVENCQDGYNLK